MIEAPGFTINLGGVFRDGDSFQIAPGVNAAADIKVFTDASPRFCSASPDLITAANTNSSDAELEMTELRQKAIKQITQFLKLWLIQSQRLKHKNSSGMA